MEAQTQDRKIKCPHCGWIRTVPASVINDESMADAVRGIGEAIKAVAARVRAALADAQLDEANAWIDMPACPNPNCGKVYRYNARTGEVAP
jgi:transcription elongation factor Elf1